MIKRIWHGWTTPANADRYERLLREEIFEGIASKAIGAIRRAVSALRAPGVHRVRFRALRSVRGDARVQRCTALTLAFRDGELQ